MNRKLLYESDGAIARLTLNRPEKRNALDRELISELLAALESSSGDARLRVLLIRGAGKDFCAGADLAELEKSMHAGVLENISEARHLANLFRALREHPLPVLAAVHGRALAGGCGLATACDLVLAAESAQFGYPEVNIGFVPAMVMAMLRRSVSEKAAFELVATGETIPAARAAELGLVQRLFTDQSFEAGVNDFAEKLAAKPVSAIALFKRLLYQIDALPFSAALESGIQVNAIARMSDDCRRGVDRFLRKK
ncbi:MAG TPA: enoyl-CoA hydratase-related protein [Bryobacteraceae bacterium]|nr:enoyl-CoA hydratase-related protein [Bryobacteraceae bacterium]